MKMKDSGVEWIGEIPEGWEVKRGKELFHEINDRCENPDDYKLLSVSEYYGVAPKSEKIDDGDFETHAETLEGYKLCKEKDIVMNIMLAWKRATGMSEYEGLISPAYCIYRSYGNLCEKYYHYLLRTDEYAGLFKQYSTGIIDSRLRLYPNKFLGLKYHYPPKETQQKIATYLDEKCSQIERTIQNQQQVIEKLKEYKQAVITEAVDNPSYTKWNLGYLSTCKNGLNYVASEAGEKYKFLNVGDFQDYFVLNKEEMFSDIITTTEIDEDYYLQSGDIVFVRSNGSKELVGRAVMIENIDFPVTYSGFCIRLRNIREDIVDSKYLLYFFRSFTFRNDLTKYSQGSNISNINQDLLSHIKVAIPALEKQKEIVEDLNRRCKAIDESIEKKQQIIEKLTEYKKSLIYECVTGKKEV